MNDPRKKCNARQQQIWRNQQQSRYDRMTSGEFVDHAADLFANVFLDHYLYNKRIQELESQKPISEQTTHGVFPAKASHLCQY